MLGCIFRIHLKVMIIKNIKVIYEAVAWTNQDAKIYVRLPSFTVHNNSETDISLLLW